MLLDRQKSSRWGVGSGEQTGGHSGAVAEDLHQRAGGGSGPRPTADSRCDSEQVEAACFNAPFPAPTPHPLCELHSPKIAGEEPQGMTAQGGGGDHPGSPPAGGPCDL